MFDDKFFDDWLDSQAQIVMTKITTGEGIAPEQMMILMLKAQTNHFAHLDIELRQDIQVLDKRLSGEMQSLNERLSGEMKALREDMDKRFEQVDKRFEQVDKRFEQVVEQADKRFEQVDKRFEQVDKRFEQVDKRFEQMQAETAKRFEQLTSRIDSFMVWSFATTVSVGATIVAAIKFL